MILGGFIHVFFTYFENSFYTYVIPFLELKDNFARSPAPKFGLLCKFDFPIFFNLPEMFLIVLPYSFSNAIS